MHKINLNEFIKDSQDSMNEIIFILILIDYFEILFVYSIVPLRKYLRGIYLYIFRNLKGFFCTQIIVKFLI